MTGLQPSKATITFSHPMRFRLALVALAALAVYMPAAATGGRPPAAPERFFGMAPQTTLTDEDAEYMKAGGIGSVRLPLVWADIQKQRNGGYEWAGFDAVVGLLAKEGIEVLPSIGSTPRWLSRKPTRLPVYSGRQRAAWMTFLRAAVGRYGTRGAFWIEHGPGTEDPLPKRPIRTWQVWNEPNFFYFAFPVSPRHYAKLVTISSKAIKQVDPRAGVLLAGLFGEPTAKGKRGMPATQFLREVYRAPGIKSRFDAVALHPYAVDAETLAEYTERMRDVVLDNRDGRTDLYLTELGWGSQNNFNQVAFEQGIRGQVRQLRDSYRYLLENRHRLNLKGTYWFTWKDIRGACNFCDSSGLFREGPRFKPKPAWRAFVALSRGRARP
jgi:Beta-galactosidase